MKRQRSPRIPDNIPIIDPIRGKHQAALVRLGGLLEKNCQLIGILVKNIIAARKSNKYLF